ncbi:hypothetical protein D3C72_919010 [compost metagenome]
MISRVVDLWGENQNQVYPGTAYYNAMKQVVIDINAVYDCAGIRRPVIQGTILENFHPYVTSVAIPCDIIRSFDAEIPFAARNTYFDLNGNCRSVNFSSSRIVIAGTDNPDITKVETKMWFYYLAKTYIDLGYRSIHMGQFNVWSKNDAPVNYIHTKQVLTKIRNYAASKGTFILLTQESKEPIKFPGTDMFMFDYGSQVMWPTEQPGAGPSLSCSSPTGNYLAGTPCANEPYKAVIDNCIITHNGNTGGISPTNGCYLPYLPFTTFFDFGMDNGTGGPPGVATNYPLQSVWGWEDTKWFTTKISETCRNYWLNDAICRMRTYYNGFGYMYIPALIPLPMPENVNKYEQGINPTSGSGAYLMADEPTVLESVKNKLTPPVNLPINFTELCTDIQGPCFQDGLFRVKRRKGYRFFVSAGDCITTKTWHIKNPDGSWQPVTYGDIREFYPLQDGLYTIYLRRDDLSWPATNGTYTYERTSSISVYMQTSCCLLPGFEQAVTASNVSLMGDNTPDADFEDYIKNRKYSFDTGVYTPKASEGKIVSNGVVNFNNDVRFSVYPNPAANNITIVLEEGFQKKNISIQIIDALGRVRNHKSLNGDGDTKNKIVMDISNLPAGVYLVKINNVTKKIVKL